MSETKFTPGRWVWKYENLYSEIEGEKDKPVLVTDYDVPERTAEDSNLIAAAPDLYQALENVMREIQFLGDEEHYFGATERFDAARAALSKARGES